MKQIQQPTANALQQILKEQIKIAQEAVNFLKRITQQAYEASTKDTQVGQQAFLWLNANRQNARHFKKRLKSLQKMQYELKYGRPQPKQKGEK